LLVLFFAGLLGLWWADYARIPTAATLAKIKGRVLPELIDLAPEQIRRVEVVGDGARLEFRRRDDGGWEISAPVRAPADRSRLDALVINLKELPRAPDAGTIDGPPDRFGLDKPSRTVRLFGADGQRLAALELGRTLEGRRYVHQVGRPGIDVV